MKWARKQGIIIGARGSVGGSVVAYSLDISKLEPIRWNLYFERFLNPERESPPDIDMDIQDNRRMEVINYVEEKYGKENMCGVAAFGRLKTRAAIRDVSRVMKIDLSTADKLSKIVEVVYGKPKPISWMLENNSEFAEAVNSSPQLKEMTQVVSKIENLCRHVSTHACGYLITPEPNMNYVPLQTETGASNKVITQIEFTPLEYLGLMKFDFLGLSNLSIIDYTVKLLKKRRNIDVDIYNLVEDDKKTFKLIQDGNTTAVFQFESAGMKRFLKELHPENLEDLCFMAAAYRPGPMQFIQSYIDCKHGRKEPEYIIPELEPILGNTYGSLIYQEQVLKIAVDIAGYSMGQADILRRAMGKKVMKIMNEQQKIFVDGCINNGFTKEVGEKLFEYMLEFANYGFPKGHAAAYGVIGYWTAYLKAHYPLEFMSARLTADMSHPDKLTIALEEVRSMGLTILPPDINKSHSEFVPEGENAIRYGFDGIKNVGHNVVSELIAKRDEFGEYKSLDDLCMRVTSINSRTLESLIKVGALDSFGESNALLESFPSILTSCIKDAQKTNVGQLGIFGKKSTDGSDVVLKATPLKNVPKATLEDKLGWEKDLLGVYFTSHPIQEHSNLFKQLNIAMLGDANLVNGADVVGGCLITNIKQINTKKGDAMAFLTLEDTNRTIEAVLFPKDYLKYKDKVKQGDVVLVKGSCNLRNGEISIIVNYLSLIRDLNSKSKVDVINSESKKMATVVLKDSASPNDLEQLRDILLENHGDVTVIIRVVYEGKVRKFKIKKMVDSDVIDGLITNLPLVEKVIWEQQE